MQPDRKQKKDPERVAAERTRIDPNGNVAKMLEMIGERKRVLDLGCANGAFARSSTTMPRSDQQR